MNHILKPMKKMKTVANRMEKCLQNDCRGCWLKDDMNCQNILMYSALYYLQMALEKSEGGNGGKKKTGTDAAGIV